MPRAGLDPAAVIAAAAGLADEVGLANVTMGSLAARVGVRPPSLYKHVTSQADVTRRVAELALTELGDALREALQGRSGYDALSAAAHTLRSYVVAHPGRTAATGLLDPASPPGRRVLDSLAAVLSGYPVDPAAQVHRMRLLRTLFHGFAMFEVAGSFRIDTDLDDSFEWMIGFVDRGLRS